ncbi:MAG: PKD domain-containing protein, partial [Cytophagaceae bacterium]|nr:PKD domain-containing protein [Cytophagaceae bacterium]
MKTILLSPRSVLAWLMLLMVALSCKDEEQPKPLGQVVFWTASKTLGGSYIEVFLKNQSIGKITSYQPYAPDCDESGYVTAKLEAGTHDFTATGEDGTKFSGRVSVQENGCTDYEFVDRNPGGGTGGGGSTVANFTYSPSQNLTAPVKIAFTNTSKNAETYRWDFGDGTTSTEANPAKEFTKAGTYKIKLTATGKTTSADYSADITVNAAVLSTTPVADFTYSPSSNLTAPVKITFTNTSKNATSYQWGFGDGTTSTAVSPTKEFTKAGDYSVKLTATDAKNQTAQKTVTIPVKAAAVLPVADWTWTASNLKVTFTNQSKNATSYTWNFNDGTTSTAANPTHDYAKAGTYTV